MKIGARSCRLPTRAQRATQPAKPVTHHHITHQPLGYLPEYHCALSYQAACSHKYNPLIYSYLLFLQTSYSSTRHAVEAIPTFRSRHLGHCRMRHACIGFLIRHLDIASEPECGRGVAFISVEVGRTREKCITTGKDDLATFHDRWRRLIRGGGKHQARREGNKRKRIT